MDIETSDSGEQKAEEQPELDEYRAKLDNITNHMLLRLETGDYNFVAIRIEQIYLSALLQQSLIHYTFGKNDSECTSIL